MRQYVNMLSFVFQNRPAVKSLPIDFVGPIVIKPVVRRENGRDGEFLKGFGKM